MPRYENASSPELSDHRPADRMADLPFDFGGPQLDAVLNDPRWFVEDFSLAEKSLSFVLADRGTLSCQPFLDHRWNRHGLVHRHVDQASLVAKITVRQPPAPLNFIWHTSHCCSTLLAELLDCPGHNLSLREPFVLVPVADAKRLGAFDSRAVSPRLPEVVFRLLARPGADGAQVTVKPSNFANYLLQDAVAHTTGRMLFLYSDLASFLVSVAKGRHTLHKYARQLFANIAGDDGKELPWSVSALVQMSDLEIAAIAWHMQIAEFRRGWQALAPGRAASLDCDAFFRDPAQAMARLDDFFGYGLGPARIRRVLTGPILQRHAKSPSEAFNYQRRQEASAVVRRNLGGDIDRIVAWSYEQYPDSPRGAPLPNALMPIDKTYC